MGAQQYQFAKDSPTIPKFNRVLSIKTQYQACYENWLADPNYLQNLMHQNKTLTNSIIHFFPNARQSYQQFLQMVNFLHSYDLQIQHTQYAQYNVHNTTILDRFIMLILKLSYYQQLEVIIINREEMQNIFIQFMRIFIPNPRKGFIDKLCDFIGLKDRYKVKIKQYSANLRQYLPHIQKHIKDYYKLKFYNMQLNGYLLQNFKSQILIQDAIFLAMTIPQITNSQIKMLYEMRSCGLSFYALQKCIVGYTGPWMLVIEHVQKDSQGKEHYYKLGTYQNGPIYDVDTYQGDVVGFLFTVQPKLKIMSADKGNDGNHYFFINGHTNHDLLNPKQHIHTNRRKGIGFGGDNNKQNCKLWIDQDINNSTVHNGMDETYGFGALISSGSSKLNITKMQIWALGTAIDLNNLHQYWQLRASEIEKRRKVKKNWLVDQNAQLMFENTFAHRDQVYGQIKKQDIHQPYFQQKLEKSYQEHEHYSIDPNVQQQDLYANINDKRRRFQQNQSK